MKLCAGPNCKNEIQDNYTYCYNHYTAGQKKTDLKSGQWAEDPTVDTLMKINANLGKLVQTVNSLCHIMESFTRVNNAHMEAKIEDVEDDEE